MIAASAVALGLVVGTVIGALGGGGGVLAVPVLVYLLGQTAQEATTSSLVIVGITALVGALARTRAGLVRWRTGLAFGLIGVGAAYLGTMLNARLPQPVLLLAFAALILVCATAMLIKAPAGDDTGPAEPPEPATGSGATRSATAVATRAPVRGSRTATAAKVVLAGLAVGFLTGLLGVGGGFLVVPALVFALRMPIAPAIGTSLLIIVINSVASLGARAGHLTLDWAVVAPFLIAAIVASFAGKRVADRLPGRALGRAFAVLLLLVGVFVAGQSLLSLAS
ncbi:sulfite exporter TauE/SafE family protein [Pseudonocardia hispaniensis]|uniref:Probable membrane transporter protein n=1 Tax=Pseudonocardia hispaniensis TaxID=904933 RepID=A0ABW1J736_9PSEU